jgi:hypothetical protein
VSGGTGIMGSADATSVSVACTVDAFTVGGSVDGLAGTGLVLQDEAFDDLPVASGASYSVWVDQQPSSPTQKCDVANGSGFVGSGAVNTVVVTCTPVNFALEVVGTGLRNGDAVTVEDGWGHVVTLNAASGTVALAPAVPSGTAYTVSVVGSPGDETCTLGSNASGTVGGSDAIVVLACTPITWPVSVTVRNGYVYKPGKIPYAQPPCDPSIPIAVSVNYLGKVTTLATYADGSGSPMASTLTFAREPQGDPIEIDFDGGPQAPGASCKCVAGGSIGPDPATLTINGFTITKTTMASPGVAATLWCTYVMNTG